MCTVFSLSTLHPLLQQQHLTFPATQPTTTPLLQPNSDVSRNVTSEEHNALARKISAEATVLLKNDNGFLPIKSTAKKIVIIGSEAKDPIVHGGGSGQVAPSYVYVSCHATHARCCVH
jgi:beta-glucosidase-like glycosyl hydrolase